MSARHRGISADVASQHRRGAASNTTASHASPQTGAPPSHSTPIPPPPATTSATANVDVETTTLESLARTKAMLEQEIARAKKDSEDRAAREETKRREQEAQRLEQEAKARQVQKLNTDESLRLFSKHKLNVPTVPSSEAESPLQWMEAVLFLTTYDHSLVRSIMKSQGAMNIFARRTMGSDLLSPAQAQLLASVMNFLAVSDTSNFNRYIERHPTLLLAVLVPGIGHAPLDGPMLPSRNFVTELASSWSWVPGLSSPRWTLKQGIVTALVAQVLASARNPKASGNIANICCDYIDWYDRDGEPATNDDQRLCITDVLNAPVYRKLCQLLASVVTKNDPQRRSVLIDYGVAIATLLTKLLRLALKLEASREWPNSGDVLRSLSSDKEVVTEMSGNLAKAYDGSEPNARELIWNSDSSNGPATLLMLPLASSLTRLLTVLLQAGIVTASSASEISLQSVSDAWVKTTGEWCLAGVRRIASGNAHDAFSATVIELVQQIVENNHAVFSYCLRCGLLETLDSSLANTSSSAPSSSNAKYVLTGNQIARQFKSATCKPDVTELTPTAPVAPLPSQTAAVRILCGCVFMARSFPDLAENELGLSTATLPRNVKTMIKSLLLENRRRRRNIDTAARNETVVNRSYGDAD